MVIMDRFAFIHGSSAGQSSYVPDGFPKEFSDIVEKAYFEGRELRKKQSGAEIALIVELMKSRSGECCCAYTFVNNNCKGPGSGGRTGQYFAITILSKRYVYPECVYILLKTAYGTLLKTGKIFQCSSTNEVQYVINQFNDKCSLLNDFLLKLEEAFIKKESTYGTDVKVKCANFHNWEGDQIALNDCNSLAVFSKFCETGRIYISDEYKNSTEQIDNLDNKIQELHSQLETCKEKIRTEKASEQLRANQKVKKLEDELNNLKDEKTLLAEKIAEYSSIIDKVRNEVAKVENKADSVCETTEKMKKVGRKDVLMISLLVLNLILVTLSSCLNYCFFRNVPSSPKEDKENVIGGNEQEQNEIRPNISPDTLSFSYAMGEKIIVLPSTGGNWELPTALNCQWLTLRKSDSSHLKITAIENSDKNPRSYTFMIKCMNDEKQIVINQAGKPNTSPQPSAHISYTINVTDSKGNVLKAGSTVRQGEIVIATVENPSYGANIGWCFNGCSGSKDNVKENHIAITRTKGQAVFSYGDTKDGDKRTRFNLKVEQTGSAESDNAAHEITPNAGAAPKNP